MKSKEGPPGYSAFRLLGVVPCAIFLMLSGCMKARVDFYVNPDGKCKMVLEQTRTLVGDPTGLASKKKLPAVRLAELKKQVSSMLYDSKGVQAWKGVSFGVRGGKGWIKAEALIDPSMLPRKSEGLEGLTPRIQKGKAHCTASVPPFVHLKSGDVEGVRKRLAGNKAKPQDIRRMAERMRKIFELQVGMLELAKDMDIEVRYHFPGNIIETTNLQREAPSNATLRVRGKDVIEALKALCDRGYFLREAKAGRIGPDNEWTFMDHEALNEKLWGARGPLKAEYHASQNNLFDYDGELKRAREDWDDMVKRLGIEKPVRVFLEERAEALRAKGFEAKVVQTAGEYKLEVGSRQEKDR